MRFLAAALSLVAALAARSPASAQPVVHVAEIPIACWPTDAHRYIETTFAPPNDALTLKFYFRSVTSPDFHFVEATTNLQGRAVAILPIAEPATGSVELFAELVTRSYIAYRTEPRIIPAMPSTDCANRDPAVSWYQGQNADITVGSTRPGSQMPLGFRPDGISRFVGVTGPAAGGGGGSRLPYVLTGTGGAIAAGAFALGGSSDEPDPGPPMGGGPTTTISAPTTTIAGGGGGPTTTVTTTIGGGGGPTTTSTPSGPTTSTIAGPGTTTTATGSTTSTPAGSTTSTPGSTTSTPGSTTSTPGSTTTTPGTTTSIPSSSTTTTPGSTTSVTTTTSSSIPTTTTSSSSTTSSTPAGADLSISKSDDTDPVTVGTLFKYIVTITNNGPGTATGTGFSDNLPGSISYLGSQGAACGLRPGNRVECGTGTMGPGTSKTVQLTVRAQSAGSVTNSVSTITGTPDPVSGNNSDSESTTVVASQKSLEGDRDWTLTYRSSLRAATGGETISGRIVVNGTHVQQTDSAATYPLSLNVGQREILFEAHPEGIAVAGSWHFDFSGSPTFEVGSLRVESGQVEYLDARAIAFHLNGRAPLRFRFKLTEPSP